MLAKLDQAFERPTVLVFLWGAAVTTAALLVGRFWIPLDDGTLAQTAERVLRGQLPHRDFGDPYTGLNAMVGALSFRLFGSTLSSLRIPLVAGFAVWLPAVWLIARRIARPAAAIAASGLAAVVSVLAYPAAMPTWFGLFAVTWGLWFLCWGLENDRRAWLVGAGAAAGVSILFKVVGLYFLAAAFLAVAWTRTARRSVPGAKRPSERSRRPLLYPALVTLGVALLLLMLGRLVLTHASAAGVYHFFMPATALGAALTAHAWRRASRRGSGDVSALVLDVGALCLGVAIPVALFLVPYTLSGSLGAWFEGVFLLPDRRFQVASSPPGDVWTIVPGMCAVVLLAIGARLGPITERRFALALTALLALGLAADELLDGAVLSALWYSMRGWIPALSVWGAWVLMKDGRDTAEPGVRFAIVSTAALWALVQFPYTAPAYFFYVAPLGVLATLALLKARVPTLHGGPPGRATAVFFGTLYAFLGAGYVAGVVASGTTQLDVERGGILVSAAEATIYTTLVETVAAHIGEGALYAGPDAPEVYFLTGRANPTGTIYEFLDREPRSVHDIDALLDEAGVSVAVINTDPLFSDAMEDESLERIAGRFPEGRTVGPYIVRWRTP